MEEKMFRCLIHHQCDIVKSIPLRSVETVNVAMILVRNGAERKGEILNGSRNCNVPITVKSIPLRSVGTVNVAMILARSGAERKGEILNG